MSAKTDAAFPHYEAVTIGDKFAAWTVKFLRVASDWYFQDNLIRRAVMLETVAAVPGMVAGMTHHLRSLRRFQHDNWIKTLLDEAENERFEYNSRFSLNSPPKFLLVLLLQDAPLGFHGHL